MARQRYADEFRLEAVRLMVMDGLSAPEVAEKLGVSQNLLYTWKRKHLKDLGGATAKDGELSAAEMADELTKVRRQLAREKRINEILKKTVGYFAKDDQ